MLTERLCLVQLFERAAAKCLYEELVPRDFDSRIEQSYRSANGMYIAPSALSQHHPHHVLTSLSADHICFSTLLPNYHNCSSASFLTFKFALEDRVLPCIIRGSGSQIVFCARKIWHKTASSHFFQYSSYGYISCKFCEEHYRVVSLKSMTCYVPWDTHQASFGEGSL